MNQTFAFSRFLIAVEFQLKIMYKKQQLSMTVLRVLGKMR